MKDVFLEKLCFFDSTVEYVANGTLADHLHGKRKKNKGLNWDTRLKICIEIAQALAFLHCLEPPIFHIYVKSPKRTSDAKRLRVSRKCNLL